MAITSADVWAWMPTSATREGEPVSDSVMGRIVAGVEALWLERWSTLITVPVTLTATDDLVTYASHGYVLDDPIVVAELDGAEPLVNDGTYYVRDVTANTFKLAAAPAGAAINLTSDGTARVLPATRPVYIDQALIMQAASLYDRRRTLNGVIAGSADLGPVRVGRFDPDIERLLDDQSWGVA